MISLKDDGSIIHDGEMVGYLGWHENTLVDISISEKHQNQGYATEAVAKLVQRVQAKGHSELRTTTVVSNAMEVVLQRNGFEPEPPEPINIPDSISDEIANKLDKSQLPKKQSNCWVRKL